MEEAARAAAEGSSTLIAKRKVQMNAPFVVGAIGAIMMAFADLLGAFIGRGGPGFAGAVVGLNLAALALVILATAFWLRGSRSPLLVIAAIHLLWGLLIGGNRLMISEMPSAPTVLLVLGGAVGVSAYMLGAKGPGRSGQRSDNN